MANGIVNGGHANGRLRKDLIAGHAEGAAFGGMVGLGEAYLPAFALAVGLGEITVGLVASLPLLAGGLMQTISPLAIRRLASYKRWVLICAFVQAASFVPMIVAAARGKMSTTAILLVAAVYWAGGLAAGPAWNTWMGALVPRAVRARFFAHRTRASQFAVLAGFVAGGCLLQWADGHGAARRAFLSLFVAAGACRLLSLALLAIQREPALLRENIPRIPTREILTRMRDTGVYRLLLYLVAVQGSVQLAGPFFTPFMFEKLRLSYGGYVALVAMAFMAKIVMLPAWGSFAHRLGALRLLWVGGLGIVPLSAMWIFSANYGWLLFVQALAGVSWGAYELGFFLLFFESIPDRERTSVLTFYNLGNTAAWVLGSALGGLLLYSLGTDRLGYLVLFGISSIGRCLALLVLRNVPSTEAPAFAIGMRTVGVRPVDASIDTPILPSLPDQASDPSEECRHGAECPGDRASSIPAVATNGRRGPLAALAECESGRWTEAARAECPQFPGDLNSSHQQTIGPIGLE
jgi:MFS family permease